MEYPWANHSRESKLPWQFWSFLGFFWFCILAHLAINRFIFLGIFTLYFSFLSTLWFYFLLAILWQSMFVDLLCSLWLVSILYIFVSYIFIIYNVYHECICCYLKILTQTSYLCSPEEPIPWKYRKYRVDHLVCAAVPKTELRGQYRCTAALVICSSCRKRNISPWL